MSVSLGGFKFVGYRYVTPADPVYTDEILKMHKCKLKAFMEANTASGSSWAFSQTSGDYSFGTYGNVIYSLGTTAGVNLVSFLRHGSDNAYHCIATFGNMALLSGSGDYALVLENYYRFYESSSNHTVATNDMSCSGLDEISPSNVNVDSSSGRLRFYSCNDANLYTAANGSTIDTLPATKRYYGYAIKGKTIISFIREGDNTYSCVKIDCIDGLSLCSPSDQANIFSFITNTTKQTDSTGSYMLDGSGRQFGICQVLRGNGARYEPDGTSTSGKIPTIFIMPPQKAVVLNGTDNMPYEGALLTPGFLRTLDLLNTDGILAKGQASVDILAVNNVYPYGNITPLSAYANGNYLCLHVYCYSGSTYGTRMYSKTVYCGWDPSNPDITVDASWPVYSE